MAIEIGRRLFLSARGIDPLPRAFATADAVIE
jgi:hypothetical protein